jgi:glycerate dehydrogenase
VHRLIVHHYRLDAFLPAKTDKQSPMKIVVLDGYTLNPGDLSWESLHELGKVSLFDRSLPEQILLRAQNAEILLTNKTQLSRETIESLPRLRYIGVLATGYNVVDVEAARERDIIVCNVPGYGAASVAQTTFSLLLELTNHVERHSQSVHSGAWSRCDDWSYHLAPLRELCGLTMGLVGYGDIAQQVARIAHAFGMQLLVTSRTRPAEQKLKPFNACFADFETLLRESDVVSLHCPLTPQTNKLIGAPQLALMKRSAFLINTARGPLLDEEALALALCENVIAGAGLDVLSQEPPPTDHPLIGAPHCIITPHNAWATGAARARLLRLAVENVRAFLKGAPQNVINA